MNKEDIQRIYTDEIGRYLAELGDEKTIRANIKKQLDKEFKNLAPILMGLEKKTTWHDGPKWAVDHCNGRAGESAAGDAIRAKAQEAVFKYLEDTDIPTLTPDQVQALVREYQEVFNRKVREALRARAETDAAKFLHEQMMMPKGD